jgi:acyl-CoA thioester hydrolase
MKDAPVSPEHRFPCKVYYEDTDCMGVVYHANYLKYFERSRTEFLAARGTTVQQYAEQGLMFVVYRIDATFRAPARLGDTLDIVSRARLTSTFRVTFEQRVERAGQLLVKADVELVCIDRDGGLKPVPDIGVR